MQSVDWNCVKPKPGHRKVAGSQWARVKLSTGIYNAQSRPADTGRIKQAAQFGLYSPPSVPGRVILVGTFGFHKVLVVHLAPLVCTLWHPWYPWVEPGPWVQPEVESAVLDDQPAFAWEAAMATFHPCLLIIMNTVISVFFVLSLFL